jgi:hypothetical protein
MTYARRRKSATRIVRSPNHRDAVETAIDQSREMTGTWSERIRKTTTPAPMPHSTEQEEEVHSDE